MSERKKKTKKTGCVYKISSILRCFYYSYVFLFNGNLKISFILTGNFVKISTVLVELQQFNAQQGDKFYVLISKVEGGTRSIEAEWRGSNFLSLFPRQNLCSFDIWTRKQNSPILTLSPLNCKHFIKMLFFKNLIVIFSLLFIKKKKANVIKSQFQM